MMEFIRFMLADGFWLLAFVAVGVSCIPLAVDVYRYGWEFEKVDFDALEAFENDK